MPAITSILAAAAIAATAGSAISQADSARKARNQAADAAKTADPASGIRPMFQDWLADNWGKLATTDPNQIMQNPSFQFQKAEGERGIANLNSSIYGSRRNGTLMEDMDKFNTGLLSNFTHQQFLDNMALLGLGGNFAGMTTGNPGMAGSLELQGSQNAITNNQNMWSQIGGGLQYIRNMATTPSSGGWNGSGMSENEWVIGN